MKIINVVKGLLQFFQSMRRSGHTSLIQTIAKKHDVYVIVTDEKERELFHGKVFTLTEFDSLKSQLGVSQKPILIDNHAMLEFLRQTEFKFNELNKVLEQHQKFIRQTKNSFDIFSKIHL